MNRGCCGLALTFCPRGHFLAPQGCQGEGTTPGSALCGQGWCRPRHLLFAILLFNVRGLPWCVTARDAGCR